MLSECSLCRWQTLNCPSCSGEELFPSLVHTLLTTGTVIQQNYKSFRWFKPFWTVYGVCLAAKEQNAGVTSLYAFQVSHVVLLPLSPKKETVSHPVKAWNIGKAMHQSGPSTLAISCAAKNRKFFSTPKAIHNSTRSSC